MKYRKKSIEIEAMRLLGSDSYNEILKWCKDAQGGTEVRNCSSHNPDGFDYPCIHIKTLEGVMTASTFDYVIKGIKGEFYPCKSDIFELTYDKV